MARVRPYILIASIALIYAATIPMNTCFNRTFMSTAKEPDVIQNVFGGMRSFVADWAFLKAEEYHHRGLPFLGAAAYHQGRSTLEEERSGGREEEYHRAQADERSDFFSKVYGSVKITEDSHLSYAEEKEVLPWFYTEVAFNPHDIRGYVLGGYWLERLGRREESMRFLKEGERLNPDSAQILTAIGALYYHDNKYDEALSYLERARKLWLSDKLPNVITNDYMETDRRLSFELEKKIIELKRAHATGKMNL